jgi:hypothetical protein
VKAYAVQGLTLGCLSWYLFRSLAHSGRKWTPLEVAPDVLFCKVVRLLLSRPILTLYGSP